MKNFILFIMLTGHLLANTNYPELFSQLGTPLYKADKAFRKLPQDQQYSFDLKSYHRDQDKALRLYETGNKTAYFKALRNLSKKHDKIISAIKRELSNAIRNGDYEYFLSISNAGIDSLYQQESFKSLNYTFYLQHKLKGESAYLEERIRSEKGYKKLYSTDISTQSYSSSISSSQHKRQEKVILLSRPGCGYCVKAKKFMNEQGISYSEYNIFTSTKGRSLYKRYHGTGVPLIIIGNEVIRGYSASAILSAL